MTARDIIRPAIANTYYEARNDGQTMEVAATLASVAAENALAAAGVYLVTAETLANGIYAAGIDCRDNETRLFMDDDDAAAAILAALPETSA